MGYFRTLPIDAEGYTPGRNTRRRITLNSFAGGVNLRDDPGKLSLGESPYMENLIFSGGCLRPRPGVRRVFDRETILTDINNVEDVRPENPVVFYDRLFHGLGVVRLGGILCCFDPEDEAAGLHPVTGENGEIYELPEDSFSGEKKPGSFFAFGDQLYFKAPGCYVRLRCNEDLPENAPEQGLASRLTGENLLDSENNEKIYTPIVAINRSADGSRSDAYQPENRLSPRKTVWFDIDDTSLTYVLPEAGARVLSISLNGDTTEDFQYPQTGDPTHRVGLIDGRYVNLLNEGMQDETEQNTETEQNSEKTALRFDTPLYLDEEGWTAKNWLTEESRGGNFLKNVVYSSFDLPHPTPGSGYLLRQTEGDAAAAALSSYSAQLRLAIYRARRDFGEDMLSGRYLIAASEVGTRKYISVYLEGAGGMRVTDYNDQTGEFRALGWVSESIRLSDDDSSGSLTIRPSAAAVSNRLQVTYETRNAAFRQGRQAISDCHLAHTLGGSDAICVVMAGAEAQPNGIFWTGNGSYGVDPTYFPMDQYNLCGSYHDPVTGFGTQQSSLIILQEGSVGKAAYTVAELGGRRFIDLTYRPVNGRYGCDLPGTIALCGNNLVWASRRHGVLRLRSTSPAGENQVQCLSDRLSLGGFGNKTQHLALQPGALAVNHRGYYCLFLGGGDENEAKLLMWDISRGTDPACWSLHTLKNIKVSGVFSPGMGDLYLWAELFRQDYVNRNPGELLALSESAADDMGQPIHCLYLTPILQPGPLRRSQILRRVDIRTGHGFSGDSPEKHLDEIHLTVINGGVGVPAFPIHLVLRGGNRFGDYNIMSTEGFEKSILTARCHVRTPAPLQLRLEGEGMTIRSVEIEVEELSSGR